MLKVSLLVVILAALFYSAAHAETIEVYVLEYQGSAISLATDMAEFECINLMNEIQEVSSDDLSCVRVEVSRQLI